MEQQLTFDGFPPPPVAACTAIGRTVQRDKPVSEAAEELRSEGWTSVGDGSFSWVFLSPDEDRVCKFVMGIGQETSLNAFERLPDNPHFPRIYGTMPLDDDYDIAVECEALEPMTDEPGFDWNEEDTYPPEYLKWVATWNPETYGRDRIKYRRNTPMKAAMLALWDAHDENYGTDWPRSGWDIHPGNIMRRADGTLVLNDLLA